ncbi:hypothetical protein OWV82_012490 [Melia azedarach]|uniref:Uncharacterized protein n=1 Tax=Melia azedarach TaxID=155640 RepID=A0ACC1Y1U0_MELAZ|nr:hypothetical protein OWV82_012490 [Melia azedarach]
MGQVKTLGSPRGTGRWKRRWRSRRQRRRRPGRRLRWMRWTRRGTVEEAVDVAAAAAACKVRVPSIKTGANSRIIILLYFISENFSYGGRVMVQVKTLGSPLRDCREVAVKVESKEAEEAKEVAKVAVDKEGAVVGEAEPI